MSKDIITLFFNFPNTKITTFLRAYNIKMNNRKVEDNNLLFLKKINRKSNKRVEYEIIEKVYLNNVLNTINFIETLEIQNGGVIEINIFKKILSLDIRYNILFSYKENIDSVISTCIVSLKNNKLTNNIISLLNNYIKESFLEERNIELNIIKD
jgi:hypothetical protein